MLLRSEKFNNDIRDTREGGRSRLGGGWREETGGSCEKKDRQVDRLGGTVVVNILHTLDHPLSIENRSFPPFTLMIMFSRWLVSNLRKNSVKNYSH